MEEFKEFRNSMSENKAAVAIVCAVALVVVLFIFPDKPGPVSSALSKRSAAAAPAAMVSASMDSNQFDGGSDTQTLHVRVLNRGKDSVSGLNLQVLAPGFEVTQPADCPSPDRSLGLAPAKANQACRPAMQDCGRWDKDLGTSTLEAGRECDVAIPLKALAQSGDYNIAVKAGWLQGQSESILLPVGAVHMHGAMGVEAWSRFGRRLAAVFKDLTFPVLILLLTTQLGSWQKTRDERQQVTQLLLTKVNAMSEQYYLKIASSGKGVLNEFADLKKGSGTDTFRMFYNAMVLVRHMTLLKDECGGPFFADRRAESIVAKAWSVLKPTLFAVVTEIEISKAIKVLAVDENYTAFQQGFGSSRSGAKRFADWYAATNPEMKREHGELEDFKQFFEILQAVYLYETNTPLNKYWYSYAEPLRCDPNLLVKAPGMQLKSRQHEAIAALQKEFPEYFAGNKVERKTQ